MVEQPRGREFIEVTPCFTEPAPKKKRTREKDEQDLMRDYLERHEYAYTWSRTDKRTTGILGTADFTIPALKLALEFKQPGGKLSPTQEIWRERHCQKGGHYAIVTSFEAGINIIEDLV